MKRYTTEDYLKLVPQNAIRMSFIDAPGYNAAWDYCITPEGRHFIPCCAEGSFPEYVKLYEFLPETGEMKLCFDMETSLVVYPRTIRPSKIHTSICPLSDGRLIMATHTTASAPTHPHWMPEAYYTHLWEGFMGSNIIIYDPATGEVEDLGIPVPRVSFYGAKYIERHNCLFLSDYFRGHAYRFDLNDRCVTDYGQCMEFGVCYLQEGPDGHLYFSTRSGALWRFNVDTLEPEYTGIEIPRMERPTVHDGGIRRHGANRNVMTYAANGPDGRIYLTTHVGERFFAYDPENRRLETLGYCSPAAVRHDFPEGFVAGMAFDREGKLWYTEKFGTFGKHLCRLDILNPGAQPEDFGLIGTRERACFCVEDIIIRDDILYICDTNYELGCPGVISIDLEVLRCDATEERSLGQDICLFFDKTEPIHQEFYEGDLLADAARLLAVRGKAADEWPFIARNPFHFGRGRRYVCKLWKRFGDSCSAVEAVSFDAAGNVLAYIRAQGGICARIRDGELLDWEHCASPPQRDLDRLARITASYPLPAHPGRQYLARASAMAEMADGSLLVGTGDGCLAVINNGRVFALGPVCNGGAIHDIAASPDGKKLYGVAGDPESLGVVFSFDAENGLELCGSLYYEDCYGSEVVGVSCEPHSIAVSPDGTRVAVGVRDRLGSVYEIEIQRGPE